MGNTTKILLLFFFFFQGIVSSSHAQRGPEIVFTDTLQLTRVQSEAILLANSLSIVAEKLQIDQAEALRWQAELWPNPNFSIDEVNLWTTSGHEEMPPFWGKFGRNQQVSAALEQLIQTAGKRRKLVALEQVSVEQAEHYFRDFLRGLKGSFRTTMTELQYLQSSRRYHQRQLASISELTDAMQRQVELNNLGKADYIRLKAAQLELKKHLMELDKELVEKNHSLTLLLNIPSHVYLDLGTEGFVPELEPLQSLQLSDLEAVALEERPDLQLATLAQRYYTELESYEKAQRTPDLKLKLGYDRGGNFMLDFVGLGASIDLPVFHRNQGNIRHAQLGKTRTELQLSQKRNEVLSQVKTAYFNLMQEVAFYEEIDRGYDEELDALLDNYTANFSSRNISLLVYLDFLEAYLDNKETLIGTIKSIQDQIEELQFLVGRDL